MHEAKYPHQKMREKELHVLLAVVAVVFVAFLVVPMVLLLAKSFQTGDGALSFANYMAVFQKYDFLTSIGNSIKVSACAAMVAVVLAFLLAYTVNCTNIPKGLKKAITLLTQLPMLLPTITYGFAILYSFGRTGLITRLLGGKPLFDIYGFNGLLIGYVIYTLPTAFLLIHNSFQFVDKKFMIVSRVMGDNQLSTFLHTIIRPLAGTICVAFIQSFFLSFTDYGIPTSIGGKYSVIALELFNQMLGSVPDFNKGAVVAVIMLIPSIVSIVIMAVIERYNIRYSKVTPIEIPRGRLRDTLCGVGSIVALVAVLQVFVIILIVPFVQMWPYQPNFTLDHIQNLFTSPDLNSVFFNSLLVSVLTAVFGCLLSYAAALITARSHLPKAARRGVDAISSIVNTLPGMVLGIGFLFAFTGGPLQSTFAILVICNIIHYFATPYQMMKDSLSKMNASWETTAKLMGDNWLKTVARIVTPNAAPTILQVFGYYFVNAMVTISAVVFLTGPYTMVMTTKISSLQHLGKFDDIFALSLLILVTNLVVKGIVALITHKRKAKANQPGRNNQQLKMMKERATNAV